MADNSVIMILGYGSTYIKTLTYILVIIEVLYILSLGLNLVLVLSINRRGVKVIFLPKGTEITRFSDSELLARAYIDKSISLNRIEEIELLLI